MLRNPLLASACALAILAPQFAHAQWQVRSEFQLHLTENTFDKMIQDFWQSLQGTQKVAVGNIPVNLGDTQLALNGINVAVNYSFPIPVRTDPNHRIWDLKSDKVGVQVTVDQLVVSGQKVINVGGIEVTAPFSVVCNNISLTLPQGKATIDATIRAEVAQNQVQLSMPTYKAVWPSDAWQLSNISCMAGLEGTVKDQILSYLSSFQNLDAAVGSALNKQFTAWSKQASLLLLSQQELPSNSDYLKIFYEPQTARENNGDGLILGGVLRFNYPYAAQGQDYEQSFSLPDGTQLVPQSTPQLIIPFAAVKALLMGEYFSGKLEFTMRSPEISGFQTLMNSFWQKLFGWPDLLSFNTDTTFLFQFLPLGPPSFENEAAAGTNSISGNLTQPVSTRMFAPINGQYTPYVEFRTLMSGPATMTLGANGKINFKINATDQPVSYAFAQSYVKQFNPNTHIAVDTIATAARTALSADGIQLAIPPFKVGSSLTLIPADWALQSKSVLRLDFNANSTAVTTVATKNAVTTTAVSANTVTTTTTVKTTNGKRLVSTSVRSTK